MSDTEPDGDDENIESVSSSNESASSLSKKTGDHKPNAWPPSSLSIEISDDDDDCQAMFEHFSQQQSTSMRGTEGYCKQSYSECYRNVPYLNNDILDCEILKATHGKIRQK